MNSIILQGFLIGFVMSISFGPAAYLIIQKTICSGNSKGFFAGLGTASGDTIYAIIAAISISLSINFIESNQFYLRLFGGLILVIVGLIILLNDTHLQTIEKDSKKRFFFLPNFLLAIFNPLTALAYAFIFTTFNIISKNISIFHLFEISIGIFVGTNLWWGIVVFLSDFINRQLNLHNLLWLNKIIGGFMILVGVFMLISIFIKINLK